MRMMRRRIDERPVEEREAFPIQTIWFNAWMYSREESLWRALLLHVLGGVRRSWPITPRPTASWIALQPS